jgi:transposase-like protein
MRQLEANHQRRILRSSYPLRSEDEIKIRAANLGRRLCPGDPPATRKRHIAEAKIYIVGEGLRGEYSIAELCRREGIA